MQFLISEMYASCNITAPLLLVSVSMCIQVLWGETCWLKKKS